MLELESSIERILSVVPGESAEEVRPHTGVQILANLESDFDFFRKWRGDMFGYLILYRIETRVGRKISDAERMTSLDLNLRSRQCFAEGCFSKLCRGGDSHGCCLGSNAEWQAARKRDQGGTIRTCGEIRRPERRLGSGRSSGQVIHEFNVGSLRRGFDGDGIARLCAWRADKIDDIVVDHDRGHDDVCAPFARAVWEKGRVDQHLSIDFA